MGTSKKLHAKLSKGELPDLARYYIAFTTPYILMASKDDWLRFLMRAVAVGLRDRQGRAASVPEKRPRPDLLE